MKELVLLRGIPGSGKTSTAKVMESMGALIVAADDFHMKDGAYNWKPERVGFAHKMCQEVTMEAMSDEKEVIVVHNTFTTDREMAEYFSLADRFGYTVRTLVVENRHGGTNNHSVPDATLDKMENRFSIKLR